VECLISLNSLKTPLCVICKLSRTPGFGEDEADEIGLRSLWVVRDEEELGVGKVDSRVVNRYAKTYVC
jgi:hypothetical protein